MRAGELIEVAVGWIATVIFMAIYAAGSKWWRTAVGLSMMARAGGYGLILSYVLLFAFHLIPNPLWVGTALWGLVAITETTIAVAFYRARRLVLRAKRAGFTKDDAK